MRRNDLSSPDGDHYEERFATTGLDRKAAIDLGREFEQAAVFELTTREQIVVARRGRLVPVANTSSGFEHRGLGERSDPTPPTWLARRLLRPG